MLLTEGQMSDHKGARLLLKALPKAKAMIADRGYDGLVAKPLPGCKSSWERAIFRDY